MFFKQAVRAPSGVNTEKKPPLKHQQVFLPKSKITFSKYQSNMNVCEGLVVPQPSSFLQNAGPASGKPAH
jgi:hypothetical protein